MRSSFQFRINMNYLVFLFLTFVCGFYILWCFHTYEKSAARAMTGDHKNVVAGQLLEARIKAASTTLETSTATTESNEEFNQKLREIVENYKTVIGNQTEMKKFDELFDDARKLPEDPFIYYRNIKVTAFNLYRSAWSNKWMNVAKTMGLMVNDFDNLPHTKGDKAVSSALMKINQMTALVTSASMPQQSKLFLYGQFGTLKTQLGKYSESLKGAEKIKTARGEVLAALLGTVRKVNENNSKGMLKLTEGANNEFLKAVIGFMLVMTFLVAWYWRSIKNFSETINNSLGIFVKQLSGWLSPSGQPQIQGIMMPKNPVAELHELYEVSDELVKRVNLLRKEDNIVKKTLAIPYMLISRNQRKAVYWNSSMSLFGKFRALDETGMVSYGQLLKLTDIHGKMVDPVEKAISENKEIMQLAIFKSGLDNIASLVTCTPETEYVMVQIKDLRDENKRLESELSKQLESVLDAVHAIQLGLLPVPAPTTARLIVTQAVEVLQKFAFEKEQNKKEILELMNAVNVKFAREGGLKEALKVRLAQLQGDISAVHGEIATINDEAGGLCRAIIEIGSTGTTILEGYTDIARKTKEFAGDLKRTKSVLYSCVREMHRAEELSRSVKTHGQAIEQLVKKMSVLHVNNTIMEARTTLGKKELSPQQIVMITESLNVIFVQFQKAYRMIEASVFELDNGFKELSTKIKQQLGRSTELLENDNEVLLAIEESGEEISHNREAMVLMLDKVARFIKNIECVNQKAALLSDRSGKLLEIGKASVELQGHLSKSLQGATDYISSASLSI